MLPTILSTTVLILIFIIIYTVNEIPGSIFAIAIDTIPYGDKISHIGFYGLLTLTLNSAFQLKTIPVLKQNVLLGSLGVVLFSSAEELSQYYFPGRTVDILDLLCNYSGIILASYIVLWHEQWLKNPRTRA